RLRDAVADDRVLAERVIEDRVVDARDVHERDAARAEVEVADLAVSHLPRRQAHVWAARADEAVRILGEELGEAWRVGEPNRVVRALGALAETVEDDEHERSRALRIHAAQRSAGISASLPLGEALL